MCHENAAREGADTRKTGFALKYINLYFVPPFVLLPLSPSISAAEVGKIVAVFGELSARAMRRRC